MYKYFKHSYLTCFIVPSAAMTVFLAPQWAFLVPVAIILINALVDILTPPDRSVPSYSQHWVLDSMVYLYVPIVSLYMFSLMWIVSPGDLLGLSAALSSLVPVNLLAIKQEAGLGGMIASTIAVGYVLSSNHLYAHELVHRTTDKVAMLIGRYLLAMTGDAQFSISHVYSHHRNVGTDLDSATARRGESVYAFFIRSSLGQYRESWEVESQRLANSGKPLLSLHNRVLTGLAMTAAIYVLWYLAAGLLGVAVYTFVIVLAKFLFETVNYIEHYGVVRVPGSKVEPRHSWDCDSRMSSNALLNLSRHADHHANAHKRYWELEAVDTSLQLKYGYIGTIVVAMIPFWWHRFAAPQLAQWDRNSASPEEKILAKQANQLSLNPILMRGND
ncbi:alkane 1-monooxygenase [Jeongeupia naejangsanensis]|uniref:Alkane 1-monooxygenase n=1 Tax=Jeongeupia naejangsanensis TaxID=613195 RepID=A0ABS2BQ16_9NEIS|nr:alkane 1-monooxygenase [Jeongeupia naejangsanensis]MBM3117036.1 alkane 1-monooxygenase [Jeongeupia naejangsanensis]